MAEHGVIKKTLALKNAKIGKLLNDLQRREMSVDQVAVFLKVSRGTAKRYIGELSAAGKVVVDNGTVRLAGQGQEQRQNGHQDAQEGRQDMIFPGLDGVISLLPTGGHQAFVRLLLGVTIARYHLAGTLKDGWPAGVVYGPTGAFKTAIGSMLARIFSLKSETVTRVVGRETSRSLLGRRVAAGKGTMSFRPSEYLAGPLMVLDEADKTSQELRQDLLLLLQGDSVLELEQVRFIAKSTPLLTFNADRVPVWLHPAYLRRSFVLNTTKSFDRRAVDRSARAVFADLPRLNLGALKPPIRTIPDDLLAELDEHVGRFLTAEGTNLWDVRYISKAALGYVSLGRMPLRRALLVVGRDYLITAATMGQTTRGDFASYFDALLRGLPAESLPVLMEEPEEEEVGYSLDDLCKFWAEGYMNGIKAGWQVGVDEFWAFVLAGQWRFPLPYRGNGAFVIPEPSQEFKEGQVLHLIGLPASLARKRRFDEDMVRKVFQAGETMGWHKGKVAGWNREREFVERETERGDRRLPAGKKVVPLTWRDGYWER